MNDSFEVQQLGSNQESESDDMNRLNTNTTPFESLGSKKRRLTSVVWQHFSFIPAGEDGKERAKCKKCNSQYVCGGNHGTKNMIRHLERSHKDASQGTSTSTSKVDFDNDKYRELVAEAVILHDLPFRFVEWSGIRNLLSYFHKDLQFVSRNTCRSDCLKVYAKEKDKLQVMLDKAPGRISLTSDCWSSLTNDGYICLTAHFIDKNWQLKKRILNFCFLSPPHNGAFLSSNIMMFLRNWKIDKRVMSITLDNASANYTCVDFLKLHLNEESGLLLGGEYLHMPCCAHIVNLMVQDGLKQIDPAVQKIRESVRYVKGSQGRKQKFLDCVAYSSLDSARGLRLDVPTRWNATFLMLQNALYYHKAFLLLEVTDNDYKCCPSKSEWDDVEKICKFLKKFYDKTCLFSGTNYSTANLYYPAVYAICATLKKEMGSCDVYMRNMASIMWDKFKKYWSDFQEIMAIAVVLDPRHKLYLIEWCNEQLYGGDLGAAKSLVVKEKLVSLYKTYCTSSLSSEVSHDPSSQGSNVTDDEAFEGYASFVMNDAFPQKTQLEKYLEEDRSDRRSNLDILAYWKINECRFPEVAAMARDVLSIPLSTVASESAFSTGGRVLSQYRSNLKPEVVEALICARDWLSGSEDVDELVEELADDLISLDIDGSGVS